MEDFLEVFECEDTKSLQKSQKDRKSYSDSRQDITQLRKRRVFKKNRVELMTKTDLIRLKRVAVRFLLFLKAKLAIASPIKHLCSYLNELRNLKSLNINFHHFTHKTTMILFSFLGSLSHLSKLSLSFSFCLSFDDKALTAFSRNLINMKKLSYLDINFERCHRISDFGLKVFSLHVKHLRCLSTLVLSFADCWRLSNQGIEYLFSGLSRITSLSSLSLDLYFIGLVDDECLQKLSQRSHNIKHLMALNLNLSGNEQVTSQGVLSLSNIVKSLPRLSRLELSFYFCQINDVGLGYLADCLVKIEDSLEVLKLYFPYVNKLGDQGLQNLAVGLQRLKALKVLELDFSNCEEITDLGIAILSQAFPALGKNLNRLTVWLSYNKKITDEGIIKLSDGISHLSLLSSLSLDFSESKKLSNNGVQTLRKSFQRMEFLTKVNLNFYGCENIGASVVENIKSELSSCQVSINI